MAVAVFFVASIILFSKIRFNATGDYEGLYLLKGENKYWVEITDDIFPEESLRLMWGTPLTWLKNTVTIKQCNASIDSCIKFEWNEETGRGFLKNIYPDGRKLLICLGRFQDSNGKAAKGIFLGGGLPPSDHDYDIHNANETGMAYFDGHRFYHIWCNVNECIASGRNPNIVSNPTEWKFLGSKIVESNKKDITFSSRHRAIVDESTYEIEKYFFYEAGDSYFTLVTKITNVGDKPAKFVYMYGDEPFWGDYGSSKGNVGWLKSGIINTEQMFSTVTNTYAGMFDYGNSLIGENHNDYTWKANFLEWDPKNRPDIGYFANKEGGTGFEPNKPLANPDNRFIGLEWYRGLRPDESFAFTLIVGMADKDPVTSFPRKPVTTLN